MFLKKNPNLIGICAPVFWSFIPVISYYLSNVKTLIVILVALTFFVTLSFLFLLINKKIKFLFKENIKFYLLSIFAIFTFHYGYFLALKLAPLIHVFLIINLTGVFIIFYAKLLHNVTVKKEHLFALLFNLLAVLMVAINKNEMNDIFKYKYFGYLAAFIAVNSWAFYSAKISAYKIKNQFSIIVSCFYVLVITLITLLIDGNIVDLALLTFKDFFLCCFIGLFSMGGSFLCWNYGMAKGNISFLAIMSYITPILGSLWLVLFKIEIFDYSLLIAILLIISASLIGARAEKGKLTVE